MGVQEVELRDRFHAFGDDFQLHIVRHGDDAARNRGIVTVFRQVADERAVNLQTVDREALEIGERRIAGAEVVDGNTHTGVAQRLQHLDRAFGVAHHHAFGDLQFQVFRREAGLRESFADPPREAFVIQLPHRQVDRDAQIIVAGDAQRLALSAGFRQHPVAD